MTKRQFLAANIGTGLALANWKASRSKRRWRRAGISAESGRNGRVASRMAKTTKLFKSPQGFPNGLPSPRKGYGSASRSCRAHRPPPTICPNRNR